MKKRSPDTPTYAHCLKVVLTGKSESGKSAFFYRLTGREFNPNLPSSTGTDYLSRIILCNGKNVKFQIWGTTGQERFSEWVKMHYQDATIIALFVDLKDTENQSIDYIQKHVNGNIPEAAHCVVMFTKSDQLDIMPPSEDLKALATRALNAAGIKREASPDRIFITSSKEDKPEAFASLLKSWAKRTVLLSTTTNSFVLRTQLSDDGNNSLSSNTLGLFLSKAKAISTKKGEKYSLRPLRQ